MKLPRKIEGTPPKKMIEETSQNDRGNFPVELRKLRKIDETSQKTIKETLPKKNDRGNFPERSRKLPKKISQKRSFEE
jgi:hypothetical protein